MRYDVNVERRRKTILREIVVMEENEKQDVLHRGRAVIKQTRTLIRNDTRKTSSLQQSVQMFGQLNKRLNNNKGRRWLCGFGEQQGQKGMVIRITWLYCRLIFMYILDVDVKYFDYFLLIRMF